MNTISSDFATILVFLAGLFSIGYGLYGILTGKIQSGGKVYSKEEHPRAYWALVGLTIGVGIFVFILFFFLFYTV